MPPGSDRPAHPQIVEAIVRGLHRNREQPVLPFECLDGGIRSRRHRHDPPVVVTGLQDLVAVDRLMCTMERAGPEMHDRERLRLGVVAPMLRHGTQRGQRQRVHADQARPGETAAMAATAASTIRDPTTGSNTPGRP